jgi:hypothetical protein
MTRHATGTSPIVTALVIACVPGVSGCSEAPPLVVATGLDRAACRECAEAYRVDRGPGAPRIAWIRLDPWDDPARLLDSGRPVDLLLGVPAACLDDLGRLGTLGLDGGPPVFWDASEGEDDDPGPADRGFRRMTRHPAPSFPGGDPRIDPAPRAEAATRLADSLGGLVSLDDPMTEASDGEPARPGRRLGAAVVAGASHPEARSLLEFIR